MRIFGIAVSIGLAWFIGFLVFVLFNAVHDVEGASWIALLAGLLVATFLMWFATEIWEKI